MINTSNVVGLITLICDARPVNASFGRYADRGRA